MYYHFDEKVISCDESHFYRDGYVNKQNCHMHLILKELQYGPVFVLVVS